MVAGEEVGVLPDMELAVCLRRRRIDTFEKVKITAAPLKRKSVTPKLVLNKLCSCRAGKDSKRLTSHAEKRL
jgi:hypothetical protein